MAAHRSLYRENPLVRQGWSGSLSLLHCTAVREAVHCTAGREVVPDSDIAALQISLGRWQPDFMAISCSNKQVTLYSEVITLYSEIP